MGKASSTATADIGALHVSSTTVSQGFASVEAVGQAFFVDWFTVTGTPGGWVWLNWTTQLHGVRSCDGEPDMEPAGMATLDFAFINLDGNWGSERGSMLVNACGDQRKESGGLISLQVGERMQVSATLRAFAKHGDSMDAGQTARVFFDVLTPGAGIVSASGHNYAISAVPEPASALLFALGSLGLAGWRRWRC